MPDVVDRRKREEELAAVLVVVGDEFKGRLQIAMGNPPDANRIPESLWREMETTYREKLTAAGLVVYLASIGAMPVVEGASVDEIRTRLQVRGDSWIGLRSKEVAKSFVDHTRSRLAGVPGGDGASLVDVLDSTFSPSRFSTLAVTETTAANSGGEAAYRREVLDMTGKLLLAVWNIEDNTACPICKPLDDVPQTNWPEAILALPTLGPPAHPNCRCWLEYELIEPKQVGA